MTPDRRRGPLAGLRVLDLTRLLPGGLCSSLLADLGADVLKVEDTQRGDYIRWGAPRLEGADPSAAAAHFVALNRGKRSLCVDLKTGAGREVLIRLACHHDVLLESFRPGVMERLGVGPERLREANPRLIYCALSGFGQTGPLRDRAGHDLTYLARAGLLALSGTADGPPVTPAVPVADVGGGSLMAAIAVLAAVIERGVSGEGQVVDVSMMDGALAWAVLEAAGWFAAGIRPRRGELHLSGAQISYRVYACRDGWVALAAMEPKFWSAFCLGVGRPDLLERQGEPPGSSAHRELEAIFAARTRTEWAAFADEHDCCLEPVLELEEALESEHVRARGLVVEVEQPGAGPVRVLGPPVRFGRTPASVSGPAPALGADTEAALREAGYGAEEIARLLDEGVVADRSGGDGAGAPPP